VQRGDTVSLRVLTPAGPTDVVGTLLAASVDMLTVRRRDGNVTQVTVDSVAAARVVPPGPARTVATGELQRIAARGWRPAETEMLGDWLLRAAGGFTGRANSALVIGDPGSSLDDALDRIEQWYAARGLPPRVQLPSRDATPGVDAALDKRGWSTSSVVHVMTAELGTVLRARRNTSDVEVGIAEEPDEDWLASYRQDSADRQDGTLPGAARDLLVRHDNVGFASIRDTGGCAAITRATVDGRWAGLFAVEVTPAHRGRGLGAIVSLAALRWAVASGARRGYLQVAADNAPAIALYDNLGFAVHHDYVYRTPELSLPTRTNVLPTR
jgi:GNAT superfamily N-acetyltransferase